MDYTECIDPMVYEEAYFTPTESLLLFGGVFIAVAVAVVVLNSVGKLWKTLRS